MYSPITAPILYFQSPGEDIPKGREAIGWRIAVYWKDDRTFYDGEIKDFDNSTGRHKVIYSDGEEEWLSLRNERIIWRLAPSEESEGESDESEGEGPAVPRGQQAVRRQRLKLTTRAAAAAGKVSRG